MKNEDIKEELLKGTPIPVPETRTRTIYVAQCPKCEFKEIRYSNPPREIFCPHCCIWIEVKEESWTENNII